ncbi:MAG: hypothetical protein LUE64_05895 [Candidatus Gastranaerophilales bacterium]|nr:hypothetical protein [Candidatus Gastranaerophilales bacterium]
MSINAITGYTGIYSAQNVPDASIRYGRNAANNMEQFMTRPIEAPVSIYEGNSFEDDEIFATALEKFAAALESDEFTPSEYRYKYSTVNEGEFDKLAMLGASYEEMGAQKEVAVNKMTKLLQGAYNKAKLSAKPLDTNRNGKIETAEYSAFLALADIKSKDKNSENVSIIDGSITDEGVKEAVSYLAVNSLNPITRFKLNKSSRSVFDQINKSLGLEEAGKEFQAKLDYMA